MRGAAVRNASKAFTLAVAAGGVVLSLIFLPACCCVKGPASVATAPPTNDVPPIGRAPFVVPSEAEQRGPTQTQMQNVEFRLSPSIILNIHRLRGEMAAKEAGSPLNF